MKRIYERPEVEVEKVDTDVIRTSADGEWDNFESFGFAKR